MGRGGSTYAWVGGACASLTCAACLSARYCRHLGEGGDSSGTTPTSPAQNVVVATSAPHSPRTTEEELPTRIRQAIHADGTVEWEDTRMGVALRYDPVQLRMLQPVHRSFPFAVLEFDIIDEEADGSRIGAAVTIQVHDVSAEEELVGAGGLYLDAYVDKSLAALQEMDELLEVEGREVAVLDSLPAVQFFYCCCDGDGVERRVWSVAAQRGNEVVSISYSSPKHAFTSLPAVKAFTSKVRIRPPQPSNSVLIFTDPKYGVSLQVSASQYYVESTAANGGSSWREIVQFTSGGGGGAGASIIRLEAEPAHLPVIDVEDGERGRRSSESGLRYAAQVYRQQVANDADGGIIQWTRLESADESGALVPTEKGLRASMDILNSLTRTVTLHCPEELEAVAFSYTKQCEDNAVLSFIVYMWLLRGDLFVLSSVCHSDERVSVAEALYRAATTMKYGGEHGQTASLQYSCPIYQFSLMLPVGLRAFEPSVGDPHVLFCVPASSKLAVREDKVQHDKRLRLSREFYMRIRVQELSDVSEGDGGLEVVLVNEMAALAAQDVSVHYNTVTQLAGHPTLELVFSGQNHPLELCADLGLPPPGQATTLRLITLRARFKFTLELISSVNYFPILMKGMFEEILAGFAFKS